MYEDNTHTNPTHANPYVDRVPRTGMSKRGGGVALAVVLAILAALIIWAVAASEGDVDNATVPAVGEQTVNPDTAIAPTDGGAISDPEVDGAVSPSPETTAPAVDDDAANPAVDQ